MGKVLADIRLVANCGHIVWVAIRDCSHPHNAERINRVVSAPCKMCRERDGRLARLPDRVNGLRAAAKTAPKIPDMPHGKIEIIPVSDGWMATLSTGATGVSPSPTGAILAAFADELERESLQEKLLGK